MKPILVPPVPASKKQPGVAGSHWAEWKVKLVLAGWVYKQACVKFVGFEVFLITASVFPLPLDSVSLSERPLLLGGGASCRTGRVAFDLALISNPVLQALHIKWILRREVQ